MWTFSDRSFVPHAVWPAEPAVADETPVLIASGALPDSHRDVLINLATEPPADATRFGRICEIVGGDEDAKRRARLRWRGYARPGLDARVARRLIRRRTAVNHLTDAIPVLTDIVEDEPGLTPRRPTARSCSSTSSRRT